jgi:hypothetical protein
LAATSNACETSSLILREEHRLRAFESRMLSRIFGPEGLRELHTRSAAINMILADGKIILKRILNVQSVAWIQRLQDSVQWRVLVNTENEALGFTKRKTLLKQMSDNQLLKRTIVHGIYVLFLKVYTFLQAIIVS